MNKSTSEPKKRSLPKAPDQKQEIFRQLKNILSKYSPLLVATYNSESRYELVSKKAVEFMGRKKPEIYFGSAVIQGDYVGLYLMHVYVKPERLNNIAPELKKLLKGKSCFHIKTLDNNLINQVEAAVMDGIDCYKKLQFI